MKNFMRIMVPVVFGMFVLSSNASAGVELPGEVATGDILAWTGVILVGIATIWPIKKLISIGNKS